MISLKLNLPMRDIIYEYINNGVSCYELAREYGCHTNTIKSRLLFAKVKVRNCKRAQNTKHTLMKKKEGADKLALPIGDIINSYVNHSISRKELGRKYGCTEAPIKRILIENAISIRNNEEAHRTQHFRELIRMPKLALPELDIINAYIKKGMSTDDLAREYNCNKRTIRRVLISNGYSLRTLEEARNTEYSVAKRKMPRVYVPINDIVNGYVNIGIGIKELAGKYGCNEGTIKKRLLDSNIAIRNGQQAQATPYTRNKMKGKNKKSLSLADEDIGHWYLTLGHSANDIAKECLCDGATIKSRLRDMGVDVRGSKEACNMPIAKERNVLSKLGKPRPDMQGVNNQFYGKHHPPDVISKIRLNTMRQWSNVEKREAILEGRKRWRNSLTQEEWDEFIRNRLCTMQWKINKSETYLYSLLQFIYPNDWKYVGDGQFVIGGKCPDFININGKKQIIELFGDYWHRGQTGSKRRRLFAKYGYSTLIIWESELRKPQKLIKKITTFTEQKLEV